MLVEYIIGWSLFKVLREFLLPRYSVHFALNYNNAVTQFCGVRWECR